MSFIWTNPIGINLNLSKVIFCLDYWNLLTASDYIYYLFVFNSLLSFLLSIIMITTVLPKVMFRVRQGEGFKYIFLTPMAMFLLPSNLLCRIHADLWFVFFNIRNKDSEKPENIGIETVQMIQVFFLIRNMHAWVR